MLANLDGRLFKTVESYLQGMGKKMAEKVMSQRPLADDQTAAHPALAHLLRSPLAAQLTTIMGLYELLRKAAFGLVCAEMGTGKSYMSLAVAYLHWIFKGMPNGQSWLIMCPPHLVKNWVREIYETIPNDQIRVFVIGKFCDAKPNPNGQGDISVTDKFCDRKSFAEYDPEKGCYEVIWRKGEVVPKRPGVNFSLQSLRSQSEFEQLTKGTKPVLTFWIGGRERMKLGPVWRKATGQRKILPDDYLETRDKAKLVREVPTSGPNRLFWHPGTKMYAVAVKRGEYYYLHLSDRFGAVGERRAFYGKTIAAVFKMAELKVIEQPVRTEFLCDQDWQKARSQWLRDYFKPIAWSVETCPDSNEFLKRVPKTVKGWNEYIIPHVSRAKEGKTAADYLKDRSTQVPLWQYDGTGLRRWAPGEYIVRYLKGKFYGLICDELHEFNGTESAQSQMLSRMMGSVKVFLGLTGTLSNGNASSLWALMCRLAPEKLNSLGIGPKQQTEGLRRFVLTYGLLETTVKRSPEDGKTTKKQTHTEGTKERPGIMPWLQTDNLTKNGPLLQYTAFLELADVGNLPPMKEEVIVVQPPYALKSAAQSIEDDFRGLFRDNWSLAFRAISRLLTTLTCYTDRPFDWEPIYVGKVRISTPRNLNPDLVYPKEAKLLELIQQEIREGRRTIVYLHYVNFGIQERLVKFLRGNGIKCDFMSSSISPTDRIAWFEDAMKKGVQVALVNPECVKTGLNLTDWNTIIFYQSGRNIVTNCQAERRCLRIGAKREVRVFYLAYADTIQEITLSAMGRKKLAVLAVQGKFSAEGIAGLSTDLTNELARKLVEQGVTDSANEVWKRLREASQAQREAPSELDFGETLNLSPDLLERMFANLFGEAPPEPQQQSLDWIS